MLFNKMTHLIAKSTDHSNVWIEILIFLLRNHKEITLAESMKLKLHTTKKETFTSRLVYKKLHY